MKKKMLKLASLAMAAVMTLSLAACGGGSSSGGSDSGNGGEAGAEGWEWERKVTIVCPWGVGGGADGTLRPLQTVLEDELGVPVEIVNVEGAGGANGVNYAYKQPADGYTYVLGTQSLKNPITHGTLAIGYHKGHYMSQATKEFINIVKEMI